MGDITGFKKFKRQSPNVESPQKRVNHFKEFVKKTEDDVKLEQAARCMDCVVHFFNSGCPLGNKIPDFNHAVYQNDWKRAYEILDSTNNFPEFTGRICPAPCEASCVLGINNDAVAIEFIEKAVVEKAFEMNWVSKTKPLIQTGKKIAVIGSGPSGLAAADQLIKSGHQVVVYEKSESPGGLLRYGIPDYKLEKTVVARRIDVMKARGVQFVCNTEVGKDIDIHEIKDEHDAVLLTGGSSVPRDLPIEGRTFKGIHFAMDYLGWNNQRVSRETDEKRFDLKNKKVVVIGGGDTGSDCIGTSHRLGASSIVQIELLGKPPESRSENNPWPLWPMTLKTSTSHEEGAQREWALLTKRFISEDNKHVSGVEVVQVEWKSDEHGKMKMNEIEGTQKVIECDYVFLAIGFVKPQFHGMLEHLGIALTDRFLVASSQFQTNIDKVFVAGDMRIGQSLVVKAIADGRNAAAAIDEFLLGAEHQLKPNDDSYFAL